MPDLLLEIITEGVYASNQVSNYAETDILRLLIAQP